MKTRLKLLVTAVVLFFAAGSTNAQVSKMSSYEDFGHTLNLGLGLPYVKGWGRVPYLTANYEFTVAKNFTIAPFVGFLSFRSSDGDIWGGRTYYYHQTIVPIGAKGTYYFDRLLGLGSKWDLYAALSVGYAFSTTRWDNGYYGGKDVDVSPLYADLHVGAEYHINKRTGLFLDLSLGTSTVGVAIHPAPHMPKSKRG